jgi:RNA ligase (TIGR02306 family)
MPSDLIVSVVQVQEVTAHPNADKLEIVHILGWQVCCPKGQVKVGDIVVYFPPDSLIPETLANELGVRKYLRGKNQDRVGAINLRGSMSYGFCTPNKWGFPVGMNAKDELGIQKYDPPEKIMEGDMDRDHPLFHKFTDIQNIKNYPDVFKEGDSVWVSEKLHGSCCRISLIKTETGTEFMVGSHNVRRKLDKESKYSKHLTPEVKDLLQTVLYRDDSYKAAIVFGEVYGDGVQDLKYGLKGVTGFAVFAISANGNYLSFEDVVSLCKQHHVPMVPTLYIGEFHKKLIEEHFVGGKTTLMDSDAHMREGVVICASPESSDLRIGRKILKWVSDEYLLRKGGTEGH